MERGSLTAFLRARVFTAVALPFLVLVTACQPIKEQLSKPKAIKIAIQPLGKVHVADLSNIKVALENTYAADVTVLPSRQMYPDAFVNLKSSRYRADSLLRYLRRDCPDSIDYILGVTNFDISTTKYEKFPDRILAPISKYADWGVFGLGQCPGRSCVVSGFRIGKVDPALRTSRLQKISVHEVGHNLGLKHCPDVSCVMTDAVESVRTVDNARLDLCGSCQKQLSK
jgi:archaemetzincin